MSKRKHAWRSEYDAYLTDHYFGGVQRRNKILSQMVRLAGVPRRYAKRQAARLGLTMQTDRRPWNAAEMSLLEQLVWHFSSAVIAKRLRRPESSVVNKLRRLGTSRRVRDGYTIRDLELCFGENHQKIARWISNGWLPDRIRATEKQDHGKNTHRIYEKDILTFIRRYPQEINLAKVDQLWFLDLFLSKGQEVPAAKLCRKDTIAPTGCSTTES
ncbi:MAG: hypothetical protein ACREQ5_09015 [Candidatus Dormibacteria bacterium]